MLLMKMSSDEESLSSSFRPRLFGEADPSRSDSPLLGRGRRFDGERLVPPGPWIRAGLSGPGPGLSSVCRLVAGTGLRVCPVNPPQIVGGVYLPAAIRSDHADLVKLLLLRGSSVNQAGCHGRRPLHEASKLGNTSLVALLLGAGAHPDPRSNYGLTPLALAAQGGRVEVVDILLRRGGSETWSRN